MPSNRTARRRSFASRRALAACALSLAACSASGTTTTSSSSSSSGTGGLGAGGGDPVVTIGDRSVAVHLPPGYDASKPAPLLILLHGYSVTAYLEELYLSFTDTAAANGFIYVYPDGTADSQGHPFWNATDGCCNFYGSTVDDSAYLSQLIDAIEARFHADPKRVFLFGHSNGGFMAYRAACDHADQIAGIATLAGEMWIDPAKCKPSGPVSILQSHGTEDQEVVYGGAPNGTGGEGPYPSSRQSVLDWLQFDGCSGASTMLPAEDFVPTIDGAETTIEDFSSGCKEGTGAVLWSIVGGGHIPAVGQAYRDAVFQFFNAHPKP